MGKNFFISSAIVLIVGLLIFSLVQAQTPPPVPANLQVQPISSCAFKVIWDPSAGANAYDAERNGIVELEVATTEESGRRTFTDKDNDTLWQAEDAIDHIDPGETYSYRIRSKNTAAGTQSDWTTAVAETANPLPAQPGAPINITATSSTGRVDLEWLVAAPTSSLFGTYGKFEVWRAESPNNGISYGTPQRIARLPSSQIANGRFFYSDNDNINANNSYRYFLRTQEVGGDGCDPSRAEHSIFSVNSATATIPVIPSNFSPQFVETPRKITLTWNDNSRGQGNETQFNIQRSIDSGFTPGNTITFDVAADVTSYDDTNIEPTGTRTYWYRIRSCISDYCSPFTASASVTTGIPAPLNLRAVLTDTIAPHDIALSWEMSEVLSGQRYDIQRNGQTIVTILDAAARNTTTTQPNDYLYIDRDLPGGATYTYQVRTRVPARGNSAWVSVQVGTDITPVMGWVWGGHGLGWVRLSNTSRDSSWGPSSQPSHSQPYGVFLDNFTRRLAGYAWSPYGGWLSFNDEGQGQPAVSETPEPDSNIYRVTGWGKFVSGGEGGGLDQWVSLFQQAGENHPYGLYYTTTTESGTTVGQLRGFAWASNIVGWLNFGGPILKKVEQNNITPSEFTVSWDNQTDYNRVEIWYAKDSNNNGRIDDEIFDIISQENINPVNPSIPLTARGGQAARVDIPNVEANTFYGFKVRGLPQ